MTYLKLHLEILRLLVLSLVLLVVLAFFSFHIPSNNKHNATPILIDVVRPTLSKNAQIGKRLFKSNCASCHNQNMVDRMTGPALANTLQHWEDYPIEDLYSWINNPAKLATNNHPRAKALMKEWSPVEMTAFPNLSSNDIDAILLFIEEVVDKN